MFVDDLILAASNPAELETLIKITKNFCNLNNCVINASKTSIIQKGFRQGVKGLLKNMNIPQTCLQQSLKYLGVHLSSNTESTRWNTHVKDRCKKALATHFSLAKNGLRRDNTSIAPSLRLYDSIISPILFYAGEILTLDEKRALKVDRCQARILKLILRIHRRAPTQWILWETATLPAMIKTDLLKAVRWNGIRHKEYNMCKTNLEGRTHSRRTEDHLSKNMRQLLTSWGVPKHEVEEICRPGTDQPPNPKKEWVKKMKDMATKHHKKLFNKWVKTNPGCLDRKSHFLAYKNMPGRHKLLDGSILPRANNNHLKAVLNLRSHTTGLNGDWTRNPGGLNALCPMCVIPAGTTPASETTKHVILKCNGLVHHRLKLEKGIRACWPNERWMAWKSTLSDDERMATLLDVRDPAHLEIVGEFLQSVNSARSMVIEQQTRAESEEAK